MNLGTNIKKARLKAGLTQKELAERLNVYQKDISRWENGTLTPNAATLGQICRELGASADEILETNATIHRERRKGMNNTIILQRGEALLTKKEYAKFEKGDTIFGADREPKELKRWSIDQEEDAKKELQKFQCKYSVREYDGLTSIEEYALEYCECDDDGEFLQGSDFQLASESDS